MASVVLSPVVDGAIDRTALEHFQRNLAALAESQADVAELLPQRLAGLTWTAGRDGALTAQDSAGSWVTGCSLPRRAAEAMLATMQAKRGTACFLAPSHAAQIRVALNRLDATQALLAIIPDAISAAFVMSGDDFTEDIRAGRLWLAVGAEWSTAAEAILSRNEGLPLPSSFIRLPVLSDDSAEPLMRTAREIFTSETTRRAARLDRLREQSRDRRGQSSNPRILLVAPTRFRLWDDAGWLMWRTLTQSPCDEVRFVAMDPDDPRQASPLALAMAASDCDAVLTANAYRSEMPGIVSSCLPWLTWATTPRIAPPAADAPGDRLLLAEESLHDAALAAGWSVDRICLATWPDRASPGIAHGTEQMTKAPLVLISDTVAIDEPPTPFELSSHHVLWTLIRDEIRRDPFCIGHNLAAYLGERMARLGLDETTVNLGLFIDQLIAPGFLQGVARILLDNNVPLGIYGSGWDTLPTFRSAWGGEVSTRERFEELIANAGALLHPSPLIGAHLSHAYGQPVLHGLQPSAAGLVAAARAILSPRRAVTLPSLTPLGPERIAQLCRVA